MKQPQGWLRSGNFLLLCFLAALFPLLADSKNSAPAQDVLKIQTYGDGSLFNVNYELRADGLLTLSRQSPNGALIESREIELVGEELGKCLTLVDSQGTLAQPIADADLPFVRRGLRIVDLSHWRVEVIAGIHGPVVLHIPKEPAGKRVAELRDIPQVRAVWELVRTFEKHWESAKQAPPP